MSELGGLRKHQNNPACIKSVRVFSVLQLDTIRKKKEEDAARILTFCPASRRANVSQWTLLTRSTSFGDKSLKESAPQCSTDSVFDSERVKTSTLMQIMYTAHTVVADRGLQAAKHHSTSANQNRAINIPRKTQKNGRHDLLRSQRSSSQQIMAINWFPTKLSNWIIAHVHSVMTSNISCR